MENLSSHSCVSNIPSIIEWDLTNGPLRKLLELLDTQVEESVQWVLLEISWKYISTGCILFLAAVVFESEGPDSEICC